MSKQQRHNFTFKEEADVLRHALHGLAYALIETDEPRRVLAGRAFDVLVATVIGDENDPRREAAIDRNGKCPYPGKHAADCDCGGAGGDR